ncbi:FAD-dependent oxidoreductase [Rhodovastum atsumiense]|uniref:FAD-dependent oxidoreductase n=1 Tax=Rhodovastum atsumiense TaxID=504468 RepID=A0A5M6IZJ4_9PROT|nr:FAD-dependent oxidoreductase [Rhodovastum atsumiense]KAA5613711.1 FAD-dependent oxidoreductase [Rhodovastum atsumiense]
MQNTHVYPRYDYHPATDPGARHPVVIVGGGVVGLTAALDLATRGQRVVLLDDDDTVSVGSRAICFAKRTLEIYARLGLAERMVAKGVTWHAGRVFRGQREVYAFDLLEEAGNQHPAFVNLQQYYLEEWLVEACQASGLVDLRWKSRIVSVMNAPQEVVLTVETPDGSYELTADWVLACDGARSFLRDSLGLPFVGQTFRDHFLVADVVMQAGFPDERLFWFDPPFHPDGSVLLQRQADNVWRIDFQLGWDADPELECSPERVRARVGAMLGPAVTFELDWVSIYTFHCRRLQRFRHGRILFLGDSAHQVSPFGARGGNAGVQDVDNLAWKLVAVLRGDSPESLLDSYEAERIPAADENILHSTRSTDFITPRDDASRAYRDAVLDLAEHHAFARPLVNSGRLSCAAVLHESPLSTPDSDIWNGGLPPGAVAADAPVLRDGHPDWLLRRLGGEAFTLLLFGSPDEVPAAALPGPAGRGRHGNWPVRTVFVSPVEADGVLWDHDGVAASRYDAQPGTAVLIRPDQHVAARWRRFDPALVAAARRRALGITSEERQRIPA